MMSTEKESILHDRISGFEVTEILPKGWVPRDVSSEGDTSLYIILLEELYEIEDVPDTEVGWRASWGS